MIEQPAFWLTIRRDYILENFDQMVEYLRRYVLVAGQASPEFDQTLAGLDALVEEISDEAAAHATSEDWQPLGDLTLSLRIVCVDILAHMKKGQTASRALSTLVDLLLRTRTAAGAPLPGPDHWEQLWRITCALAHGLPLRSAGVAWADVANVALFHPLLLLGKLQLLDFDRPQEEMPERVMQRDGSLLLPSGSCQATLSSLTLEELEKGKGETLYYVEDVLRFLSTKQEVRGVKDFASLLAAGLRSLETMGAMPRAEVAPDKRDYGPDDTVVCEVTLVQPPLVRVRSVDPAFNPVEGKIKVAFPLETGRPSVYRLREALQKGDLVPARLSRESGFELDMGPELELYYREKGHEIADTDQVSTCEFTNVSGTQWATEDGMRLFVHRNAPMNPAQRDALEEAAEMHRPTVLRVFKKPNEKGAEFSIYANAGRLQDMENMAGSEAFTPSEADDNFADDFLAWCAEEYADVPGADQRGAKPLAPAWACLLGRLVMHLPLMEPMDPVEQLKVLLSCLALARMGGDKASLPWLEFRLEYLRRRVDFASASPSPQTPLQVPPSMEDATEVVRARAVLESLARYAPPALEERNPDDENLDPAAAISKIDMLVRASNDLGKVISMSELNNVKHTIARLLGVEPEFKSLLPKRTYYGMESDTLELKTTVVYPPANRRRSSTLHADPELQKWAILKAVCAFLNSRSGGDLLIGVDDRTSFARGVEGDIRYLYEHKYISAPNMDHYAVYVRGIVNHSFRERGEQNASVDITKPYIDYIPEKSEEGISILRVHVRPYPYGVVEIGGQRAGDPPQGYQRSYVRMHGSSEPVTEALRKIIEGYKRDTGASEKEQMMDLSRAVGERRTVLLRSYADAKGNADRRVNLFRVWKNRGLAYGMDVASGQMELFSLDKAQGVEITADTFPAMPVTVALDPFGGLLENENAFPVTLLLTEAAAQRLKEEADEASPSATGRADFPWRWSARFSSPEGVGRFVLAAAGDAKVSEGNLLKKYLKERLTALKTCL